MKLMSPNENIQELANQARVLESYLSEIQSRENLSMKIITETRASLESLKSLKDIDNVETIFNMGGGISIKSNIEKPDIAAFLALNSFWFFRSFKLSTIIIGCLLLVYDIL